MHWSKLGPYYYIIIIIEQWNNRWIEKGRFLSSQAGKQLSNPGTNFGTMFEIFYGHECYTPPNFLLLTSDNIQPKCKKYKLITPLLCLINFLFTTTSSFIMQIIIILYDKGTSKFFKVDEIFFFESTSNTDDRPQKIWTIFKGSESD